MYSILSHGINKTYFTNPLKGKYSIYYIYIRIYNEKKFKSIIIYTFTTFKYRRHKYLNGKFILLL